MQAKALGAVSSLGEIRQMVFNSFETKIFYPQDANSWSAEYHRFKNLIVN
jgi:hypothetical protein